MHFNDYQGNGNIRGFRWKVTNRSPKFYSCTYDPLDRLTAARYGYQQILAAPGGGPGLPQSVLTDYFSLMSAGYDAVGNIMSLERTGLDEAENLWR